MFFNTAYIPLLSGQIYGMLVFCFPILLLFFFCIVLFLSSMNSICGMMSVTTENNVDLSLRVYLFILKGEIAIIVMHFQLKSMGPAFKRNLLLKFVLFEVRILFLQIHNVFLVSLRILTRYTRSFI